MKFNTNKNHPEIYDIIAKELKVHPSNCLFFDDSIGSLENAKKPGLQIVGVNDNYDSEVLDKMAEVCGKDNLISDFYEAVDCVKDY